MPVRPRIQAVQARHIDPIAYVLGDGTWTLSGLEAYPDPETARRAWPTYRRDAWAMTHRGHLSGGAEAFDGLTTTGADRLWRTWQHADFALDAVRAALAEDRQAVERFRRRDPRGARRIADYLVVFLAHLDRIETEARGIAARPADKRWQGGAPSISVTGRYGDTSDGTRGDATAVIH